MSRIAPTPAMQPGTGTQARADVVALTLTKTVSTLLDRTIALARDALIARQSAEGYWCFELEADCTIPAEYIMMMHFLDEIDAGLETKIAAYLRAHQMAGGGWPLYHGGDFNMSCSVKSYYALKLAGDAVDAPHMVRARAAILERGGAARSNVFTRIALALFGQLPWRGVPYIPVEIMLLPKWFFFHLDKVSYWSRTVMVPLLILCTRKVKAKNPRDVHIRELFTTPPEQETRLFPRQQAARRFGQPPAARRPLGPLDHRAVDAARRAGAGDAARRSMDARAPQRGGWARRHFPGHGQRARGDDDPRLPG